MLLDDINNSQKLLFIIEEGQFNLGSFEKALQMIELAGKTGADAIEFQLAYADDFYISSEPGHKLYKTREFSDEQLKKLVEVSHENKLYFVATCLSHRLVSKMATFGVDGFNINASDINNPTIVDEVLETNLPFFVSMPLATIPEIDWIVNRIAKKKGDAQYILLHGQHPMASGKEFVEIADTSFGFIKTANERYGKDIGFIDHTCFIWTPSIAVAAGAQVISKHMTVSHIYKGPDHTICLDPYEMKKAIDMARATYESMQITNKELAKGEDLDRTVMRRSVVSGRKIEKGTKITTKDILYKRPGTGISPNESESIVGQLALVDIEADTVITKEMFSNE